MRHTLATIVPALFVSAAFAGPIAPLAGPVGPTMKTLTEVEPRIALSATNTPGDADSVFKITQAGSYYLTGNLNGVAGKSGIKIVSSHVTIDLNGFSLAGVAGSLDGVRCSAGSCHDVTIHSGNVFSFGGDGIDLTNGDLALGGSIRDVHTRLNGGAGIVTNGGSVLERCTAFLNGGVGFMVRYNTTVIDCVAVSSGAAGFVTGGGCTLSRCIAEGSGTDGFEVNTGTIIKDCVARTNGEDGIQAGTNCVVDGCSLQYNTLDGVRASSFVTVRNNTCDSNGNGGVGAGIHVNGSDSRIEGNACNNADFGIDIDGGGNVIVKNTCASNTTNWSISLNNLYGPIVERSGPVAPAVNGNTAPSTLTSTDPNANFTH